MGPRIFEVIHEFLLPPLDPAAVSALRHLDRGVSEKRGNGLKGYSVLQQKGSRGVPKKVRVGPDDPGSFEYFGQGLLVVAYRALGLGGAIPEIPAVLGRDSSKGCYSPRLMTRSTT
jgi:hypothetical protein